jgi:hypothetical protein
MGNGASPNGPSYRAHPRLYHRYRDELSKECLVLEMNQTGRGHRESDAIDPICDMG